MKPRPIITKPTYQVNFTITGKAIIRIVIIVVIIVVGVLVYNQLVSSYNNLAYMVSITPLWVWIACAVVIFALIAFLSLKFYDRIMGD